MNLPPFRPATPWAPWPRLALAFGALVLSAALHAAGPLAAPPGAVGPAWQRPAVAAARPERAVLLAAAPAGGRVVAVGERGLVLASDDGGRHWTQQPAPTSATLTAVRFADDRHGVAVGHAGSVLTTADAGRTWTSRLDGRRIAEIEHEAARRSGDAAAMQLAERLASDGPDKPLLDALLLGAHHMVVVGAYGIALETRDGGDTWANWRSRLPNPKELHLYAIRALGAHVVIGGEQGLVMVSDDGGASFRRVETPYKGSFFTAELPGERQIVLAGLRGQVWRSNDGGQAWSVIATPAPASVTGSVMRADGSLVLVNQAGMAMALSGDALKPLPGAVQPPLNGVTALPDGSLLMLSVQGVHRLDRAAAPLPATTGPSR